MDARADAPRDGAPSTVLKGEAISLKRVPTATVKSRYVANTSALAVRSRARTRSIGPPRADRSTGSGCTISSAASP